MIYLKKLQNLTCLIMSECSVRWFRVGFEEQVAKLPAECDTHRKLELFLQNSNGVTNKMPNDYQIGMLWVDGPLSFLEQLCMVSFMHAGQGVRLYVYGDVTNIPSGVEVRDAREILPDEDFVIHTRTGSPAPHSDKFRYRMLAQEPDLIWADTDAYCLQPFVPVNGHFHGWITNNVVASGVLKLPSDSPTLNDLIKYTEDPYAIPPWLVNRHKQAAIEARDSGSPINVGELLWGIWGPDALTWLLHHNNEVHHAMKPHVLYPIPYQNRRVMARSGGKAGNFLKPDSVSIHFYGRRMRSFLREKFEGIPPIDSLIGQLANKHDIDPAAAPV